MLDWRRLAELKEAFQQSDLPFRVDLLDWNAISAEFRNVIEKDGYEVISGIVGRETVSIKIHPVSS